MKSNPNISHQTSTERYRYSFNGMEKDNEIAGDGNSFTTHFRKYDPRIGRWLSRDPKTLPNESPYCAFLNNPIFYTDGEGDCPWCVKMLLDFGAGVAADVFIQVIAEYAFGDATSIQQAFENVDWWQAVMSGGENVLPGGKGTQAVISGISDATLYYINSENPTLKGASVQFLLGMGSAYMGDLFKKYGRKGVAAGLKKMGVSLDDIHRYTGMGFGKVKSVGGKTWLKAQSMFKHFRDNGTFGNKRLSSAKMRNKNLGYVSGTFNGKTLNPYEKMTISGKKELSGNEWVNPGIFGAIADGNNPRVFDSEFKLLSDLAESVGASAGDVFPNVTGTITLASEKILCTSCMNVTREQFSKMFPNVNINIVNGAQ